jgi:hypothetical protein
VDGLYGYNYRCKSLRENFNEADANYKAELDRVKKQEKS